MGEGEQNLQRLSAKMGGDLERGRKQIPNPSGLLTPSGAVASLLFRHSGQTWDQQQQILDYFRVFPDG